MGVFQNFRIVRPLESFSTIASSEIAFGGPVIVTDRRSSLEAMLGAVDQMVDSRTLHHRVKVLDPTAIRYAALIDAHGYDLATRTCQFVLSPDGGLDVIQEGMDGSNRRNLRSAREHDPTVRELALKGEPLRSFYRTYERAMERVDGHTFPLSLFEAAREELDERLRLVSVEVDAEPEPVGWHLDVVDEEQSTLHQLFTGVEEANFEYYPDDALHEHEIRWAIERGLDRYDFGETRADLRDGIYGYKEKFGAEPVPVLFWKRRFSRKPRAPVPPSQPDRRDARSRLTPCRRNGLGGGRATRDHLLLP